jgi:hypothetical protein
MASWGDYAVTLCLPAGSERGAWPGKSTITGTGESIVTRPGSARTLIKP